MPSKRANGEGYVFKRGKTYTARIRAYRKRLPDNTYEEMVELTKGGFKTVKEARQWCIEHAGAHKMKKASTLADYYLILYRDHIQNLSKPKQTNYATAWKRLEPLHLRKVDTITATELCDIVAESAPTYYPANDMKTILTKLFELIAADGLNSKDLPSFIHLPKKSEKGQDAFTMDEISSVYRLWQSDRDRIAACIILMIYTSMMPGELFRLTASMIDIPNRAIHGAGIKTKERKEADIVFPEFLIPILTWLIETADNGFILSENAYHEVFYPKYYAALEKAGCRRLTPYACRHTTNTLLASNACISNAAAAKVMRHSERMNERYTHINNAQALAAVDSLSLPDA